MLTCTPYGVNTHRLLVRGSRIPDDNDHGKDVAPAEKGAADGRGGLRNKIIILAASLVTFVVAIRMLAWLCGCPPRQRKRIRTRKDGQGEGIPQKEETDGTR